MTDRELELLLEAGIGDCPPTDALVASITPWRRAVRRILVGMGLCGVTLKLFLLDYILPAVGMVLILLGFRSLRRENRWFTAGYAVAVARTILNTWHLMASAAVAQLQPGWLTGVGLTLTILQALCVWGGFRAVRQKAGLPHPGRGFWLVVYDILLTLLGLAGFQGTLVILGLLVLYILLLRSLWKYAGLLEDAGYAIQAAPVAVSDGTVSAALAAVTLAGILAGYLLFSQYPMAWQPQPAAGTRAAEIRGELSALGFPEAVLSDLAESDLLACEGASAVHLRVHDFGVHPDALDPAGDWYDYGATHEKELRMTEIAVEIPGGRTRFVLFHHFLWRTDPGYRGCDAIQIWNTDRIAGWHTTRPVTGQVLCDRDGVTHTAPFHAIRQTSGFEAAAEFSLPRDGENCRGYVSYTVEQLEPGWLLDSLCHYYYQTSPLLYPARTAADIIRPGYGGVSVELTHWFADYWSQVQIIGYPDPDGVWTYEFSAD